MMRILNKIGVISVGDAVVSLKGRDTSRIYVVTEVLPNGYLLCADGKNRKISRPKLKSMNHLAKLKTAACTPSDDDKVAKFLSEFEKLDFSILRKSYYKPKRSDYSAER